MTNNESHRMVIRTRMTPWRVKILSTYFLFDVKKVLIVLFMKEKNARMKTYLIFFFYNN